MQIADFDLVTRNSAATRDQDVLGSRRQLVTATFALEPRSLNSTSLEDCRMLR